MISSVADRIAHADTLALLVDVLGQPLHDRKLGLYRWRCPVSGCGESDPLRLWRPLVLVEDRGDAADGRLYCEAALGERPSCNFTPAKLRVAIERLERAA